MLVKCAFGLSGCRRCSGLRQFGVESLLCRRRDVGGRQQEARQRRDAQDPSGCAQEGRQLAQPRICIPGFRSLNGIFKIVN